MTPAILGSYVTAAGLIGLAIYDASTGDFAGAATAALAAFGLGAPRIAAGGDRSTGSRELKQGPPHPTSHPMLQNPVAICRTFAAIAAGEAGQLAAGASTARALVGRGPSASARARRTDRRRAQLPGRSSSETIRGGRAPA